MREASTSETGPDSQKTLYYYNDNERIVYTLTQTDADSNDASLSIATRNQFGEISETRQVIAHIT